MAKKNEKSNFKQRRKQKLLKDIENCATYAQGRRLINQGIKNGVIDMGDGVGLKKKLPPKPRIKVKRYEPDAPLHGIILRPGKDPEKILLKKVDDNWVYKDIVSAGPGLIYLDVDGSAMAFTSEDEEIADAWASGATTAGLMGYKCNKPTVK